MYETVWREAAFLGRETIGGRELIVVEITENVDGKALEKAMRLYFDEGLVCACVGSETGRKGTEAFKPDSRWWFSDFREVKRGLFVPFSALLQVSEGEGPLRDVHTYKIERLDFVASFPGGFFDIDFPYGTRVNDIVASLRYTVGDEFASRQTDEALEELLLSPELLGAGEADTAAATNRPDAPGPVAAPQHVEEPPSQAEGPPEETKRQNLAVVVSILLGAVLLAIVAVVLWRKRRG